ncbi:hypothetical protein M413DRAFT_26874 [Hebeloma cylindrosporum]|uniref:Protein kinase domain-containing protein n=1 Tax=Hebeloma cylindrosporum TaxID=76867 RepID=A0A0C3CFD9_HEBCY|nr:hypothetical protein M413DRAFT_26874 [Hebeloma cylindrosporum h7]
MLAADDPFLPLLEETFDFNYDPSIYHKTRANPNEALFPDSPPLNFHDRHIGSNLVLKRLVYIPSLAYALSKLCDELIEEFLGNGDKFHIEDFRVDSDYGVTFEDSEAVGEYYMLNVGHLCHKFASKILLHPHCTSWSSLFSMDYKSQTAFLTEGWLQFNRNVETGDVFVNDEVKLGITQSLHDKLVDINRRHPHLATWNFFAMTDIAIGLLRNQVNAEADFIWDNCRTLGFQTKSCSTLPIDATKFVARLVPALKARRARISKSSATPKAIAKVSKFIEPSKTGGTSKRRHRYRPEFRHLLQHAWAKAVENDGTFIILTCGRYERIGIRHRASQTLYLSGLIDPINTQDPRYRKLHVALNMAIVRDVLERHELATIPGTKRAAEEADIEDSLPPTKRRKAAMVSLLKDEPKHSEIIREIGPRMIALVNLKYGPFCSPIPASFIRIGPSCARIFQPKLIRTEKLKRKYLAHEYFTLVLDAPRGEGSTGIVYPAALEAQVKLPSGEVSTIKTSNLVLKLAFSKDQQKQLLHEFGIYFHLARKEVKGIIPVHGIFRDSDSGVVALLMDNGGQNLRQREMERTGQAMPLQVSLSQEERAAFTAIFKSIHEARVRHMDVRADNLLANPITGEVFVIDFDLAEIAGSTIYSVRPNYDIEMQCLQNIFDKKYERMNYAQYR